VQIDRAATAGDPPAVRSAYGQRLFDLAPYYREEQRVLGVTTSRPVDPEYVRISACCSAASTRSWPAPRRRMRR
jgi:hypothetical protein